MLQRHDIMDSKVTEQIFIVKAKHPKKSVLKAN